MKNASGADEEGIGALARKGDKRRIDLADRAGVEDLKLQPDRGSRLLQVPQRGFGVCGVGRIDEHGNTNGLGHQVVQEPQPFGHHLVGEKIDAGRVAAWPGEAGDKTELDRVLRDPNTIGIVAVAALAASAAGVLPGVAITAT